MEDAERFLNKYRVPSARLQDWDYGWNAAYFVTLCTKNREHFFGEISDNRMHLSEIGILAKSFWNEIPVHFPFVEVDAFVVMPNHVHGIIIIDKKESETPVETRHCLVSTQARNAIGKSRFQNQGTNTLSSIIGSYKSAVTKQARKIHADFSWQARFHDHIIRDKNSFQHISEYILHNPETWEKDQFY
ncbi:transposase [Rufibacter sp. LB8]|uniref:transposase n=1 Tax=Rufibacter sp. LB8 TaxID=2777781 RepID=UPI00178C730B|nr:transposase [Rufibacter sp. LB8]